MQVTARVAARFARDCPENLIFAPLAALAAVAAPLSGHGDAARAACVAELLLRWLLNRDPALGEVIDQSLPGGERQTLGVRFGLCSCDFINGKPFPAGEPLWAAADAFSARCAAALRPRLDQLLAATDGFIPVYDEEDGQRGYFVPFRLLPAAPGRPWVVDAAGAPLEGWAALAREPLGDAYVCEAHCRRDPAIARLHGESLQLPLLVARWRREGALPRYDVARLLFSGSVRHGALGPVRWREKAAALPGAFAGAWLGVPAAPGDAANAAPGATPNAAQRAFFLPTHIDAAKKRISDHIVENGLCRPSFREAAKLLDEFADEVAFAADAPWERRLAALRTLAGPIDPDRSAEAYLRTLSLKAAIFCHAGRTAESVVANREAREFARDKGLTRDGLRLEVEGLVQALDAEDFAAIGEEYPDLEKRLATDGDDDLLMRFHGTMGQVLAYADLAGLAGPGLGGREEARRHFAAAMRHAFAIANAASEGGRMVAEADVAQDRNYWHLWHALFQPGAVAEQDAWRAADAHIRDNLGDFPRTAAKNRWFLDRQKAMAWYRGWLQSGVVPRIDRAGLRLPPAGSGVDWVLATGHKCLGALAAAAGDAATAARDFAEAEKALPPRSGVLGQIRLTALAQAYGSLREAAPGAAARYRDLALAESAPGTALSAWRLAPAWRAFILDGAPNPALRYWY